MIQIDKSENSTIKIMRNNLSNVVLVDNSDAGNSNIVYLSQAEYDELVATNKIDETTLYLISDGVVEGNFKTINGESIFGSGNIEIEGSDVDLDDYYTKGEVDTEIANKQDKLSYNIIDSASKSATILPNTINQWQLSNDNDDVTITIDNSTNGSSELWLIVNNTKPHQLIITNQTFWKNDILPQLDVNKLYKISFSWNSSTFVLADWEEYPIVRNEGRDIPISVLDLNIKTSYDNLTHTWAERKDELISFISGNIANDKYYTAPKCDIITLQEINIDGGQWNDITNEMSSDYNSIIANRGTSYTVGDSEGVAILYRKDRFTRVSGGFFWLRGNGYNGDIGNFNQEGFSYWDRAAQEAEEYEPYKRIAVWIILRDNTTGKEFFVINTHYNKYFYNDGTTAASTPYYSSELVKNRIDALSGNRPVIFAGDLHCNPDKSAIAILQPDYYKLYNAKDIADEVSGMKYTMNSWGEEETSPTYALFDYIFVTNEFKVNQFNTAYAKVNGEWISDHNPIIADLYLKQ